MPEVAPSRAGRIHYAERGERRPDRPSVVLIHGSGSGAASWGMVTARLARAAHTVAIDLPGHGASAPADPAALSMARYRDAVGELCAALSLGPAVLVGHSLGALVAIEAALAWPDQVRALVLCAAAPKMTTDPQLIRLLRDDPAAAALWLADQALSPRVKPAVRRGFLAAGAPAAPEIARADFAIVEATDLTDRLGALACPVTWLDGADDRITPAAAGRRGSIVTVPDAGHILPIEAPGAIVEAVLRAVDSART